MRFSILPEKLSSRLILMTLISGLMPILIFGLLIKLYPDKFVFGSIEFLFLCLGIVLILTLDFWVGIKLSLAITQLRMAMKAIKKGNLDVRVKPTMAGHLGELMVDFNKMVAKMAEIAPEEQKSNDENKKLHEEIANLKQTIADLKKAKEAVEDSTKLRSEFFTNISHEIRTPMNGVIGMTELALETELTHEQREYLKLVKDSADALLSLINDFLDFSKIESGKLELENIDFSLGDNIGNTLKTIATCAHKKGLELIYHILPDVPDALVGDPGRLRQIIVNLVGNAIKFTEKGEIVVRVENVEQVANLQKNVEQVANLPKSVEQVANLQKNVEQVANLPKVVDAFDETVTLHFSVSDTGIGIPSEKQQSIFESFTQADTSTTRKFGGTGLGLTITSQIVEMMNGRIWLESEVGKGSTFHFIAEFGIGSVKAHKPIVKIQELQGMQVLIVNDNDTNRRILEERLINWEMKPTSVDSGQAALEEMKQAIASDENFPLILLDAHMPEMDGFTFVEKMKQVPEFAESKIMMLTPAGQRGDAVRCRELGISAYLMKPITQSELLEAIMEILGTPIDKDQSQLITRHSIRENRHSLHILVVDDYEINRELAIRMIEKRGHTTVSATNGKEALATLEKETFDLVLMDVQMPEMGGFEATAKIREKEKSSGEHIPIIAITAHAMEGDKKRCLEAGIDDYISKPFKPNEVFEVINKWTSEDGKQENVAQPANPPEEQLDVGLPDEQDVKKAEESEVSAPDVQIPVDESQQAERKLQQSTPVIDFDDALKRVEEDKELLKRLVDFFIEDYSEPLDAIRNAIQKNDPQTLAENAHSLKGMAKNISADAISEPTYRLEMMGREESLDTAQQTLKDLEVEIEKFKDFFSDYNWE